jgi:asparagine synthase (glutamine-hydrolysing)
MNREKYYTDKLKSLLVTSVKKLIDGKNPENIAIALSGGIDSAIVSIIAKNFGIKKAYVVGVEDCHDIEAAEKVADELNLNLKKIILKEKDIRDNLPIQTKILKGLYEKNREKILPETPDTKLNPVSVSSNFMHFFVEKYVKEKYIISGLGSDTLLAGFFKYLEMDEKGAVKQVKKESEALLNFDYLEDVETARFFGKEILMPFLEKDVAEFCLSIPYELKFKKMQKYILRKVGLELGLSEETSFRKKKSAQYGTGIMKLMKKVARKNNMHINNYIKTC